MTYLLCRAFANGVTYRHPTETAVRRLVTQGVHFPVEILANSIRDDQSKMSTNIKGKEYKLSQYADDTCFVRDSDRFSYKTF